MEENNAYHIRSLALAAVGGIGLVICLTLLLGQPIPLEKRNASPGFGWSWDFDYESAMRHSSSTAVDAPGPATANALGQLSLPLDAKVAVAGLELIYRGAVGSGKFKVDVIIPTLDPGFAYSHELNEKEARKEFRLVDERFKLTAIGPYTLRLKHLSP